MTDPMAAEATHKGAVRNAGLSDANAARLVLGEAPDRFARGVMAFARGGCKEQSLRRSWHRSRARVPRSALFSEKSVKGAAFRRLRPAMQRLSVASSGVPSIAGTAAESSLAPRPLAVQSWCRCPRRPNPSPPR
jgi:hypothetical protein